MKNNQTRYQLGIFAAFCAFTAQVSAETTDTCAEQLAEEKQLVQKIQKSLETAGQAELFSLLTDDLNAAEEAELNDAISEEYLEQLIAVRAEIKQRGCE